MFKIFKITFFIVAMGAFAVVFQQPLANAWRQFNNKYLPCRAPIKYSIGTFDDQFGISREEFLRAVRTAEDIWEKPLDKDLFVYDPEGKLKVNLVYDVRQEATTKLKELGIAVGDDKASYENLKTKYNTLEAEYKKQRDTLEKRIEAFEIRQAAYEQEVTTWNEKGGADEETFKRLNKEQVALEKEVIEIKKGQADLNKRAEAVNALVAVINRLVASLNIQVEDLNTIGQELGEFEEGTYQSGPTGERIDIYQFDNRSKLIRVLAHEFGHALGLEHVEDPKAIMYRLNNGINEKPNQSDLDALRTHCSTK